MADGADSSSINSGEIAMESSSSSDTEMQELGATAGPNPSSSKQDDMESTEAGPSHDPMDRLFQKNRSELLFELQRLAHGDRPVTGQDNRKNVEAFFTRNLVGPSTEEEARENIEEHRPEQITVEVQGLVERRPVSSLLQGSAFRRSLENALRGGLGAIVQRSPQQRPAQVQQPRPQPQPQPQPQSSTPVARTEAQQHMMHAIRNATSRASQRQNISQRNRSQETEQASASQSSVPPPPAALSLPAVELPGPVRAQEWLQEQPIQPEGQINDQPANLWDTMGDAYRENIIMDISELVHRQLVTSTLESQFRGSLERRMQDSLQRSGTDGSRVQNFIQSLPPSNHHRNDFRDLGIAAPQPGSDDAISIISATAAVTVPYAQSNAAMTRELNAMKAQLEQMKNMMKMSFDLQLDIQRSIKQEVAAALSQASGGATAAPQPQVSSRPVNDTHCLICLDNHSDSVLYQCGHMCVCFTCGLNLKQRGAHCPVCRAPIKDIIRAYKCNHD